MNTTLKTTNESPAEIQEKIRRLKHTLSFIEISKLHEIRLMFGTLQMLPICDSVYPIAEIKQEYMKRLKYSILEHESQLMAEPSNKQYQK
jgi:hypothetical protein